MNFLFTQSKVGLYKDAYISRLVPKSNACKTVRRAPVINYGYTLRVQVMTEMIHRFIANFTAQSRKVQVTVHKYNATIILHPKLPLFQVISLGAGSDSTFFRLFGGKTELSSVRYTPKYLAYQERFIVQYLKVKFLDLGKM